MTSSFGERYGRDPMGRSSRVPLPSLGREQRNLSRRTQPSKDQVSNVLV